MQEGIRVPARLTAVPIPPQSQHRFKFPSTTILLQSRCTGPLCAPQSRNFSTVAVSVVMGTAPMTVSSFFPPLKIMTVGMLLIPNSVAMLGLSSVFSFRHNSFPLNSFASSSMRGAIIRQGPHQGAQKSTNTGTLLFPTSSGQVLSETTPVTAKTKTELSTCAPDICRFLHGRNPRSRLP